MFFFVREARFQSSHAAMVVVDGIEPPSRGLQPRATPSQLNDHGATDPNRTDVISLTEGAPILSATAANWSRLAIVSADQAYSVGGIGISRTFCLECAERPRRHLSDSTA